MGQAAFEFDTPPPAFETDTAFEIGWDFAHFALTPPGEHLQPGSALQKGFDAGRASFGTRTLAPTQHTRKWLQLRLNAWRRGRIFEGLQVTPNYLSQIDAAHCPITREALTHATCTTSDASIDRVRNDAGYAAGNLVVMSTRANAAKGDADFDAALARMRFAEAATGGTPSPLAAAEPATLTAAQWARIAILCTTRPPRCRCSSCRRIGCVCSTRCRPCKLLLRTSSRKRAGPRASLVSRHCFQASVCGATFMSSSTRCCRA